MTTMSARPEPPFLSNRSVRLSSSSMSRCRYGTTPQTGIPVLSSNIVSPGFRIPLSPRNLLMIVPLTRILSCSSRSSIVPTICANTPPRSISPARRTGASTISASPILTISFCFRLISAGLPAPSITITSYCSSNR